MLRYLCFMVFGLSLFAGSNLRAEDFTWAREHPEARDRLLKIFEKHAGFRESITEFSVEHHTIFKEMVDFLAEKHERSVEEFIRIRNKEDKETPHLQKIHDKYREGMGDFRDWIKEHKDAAVSLTNHERELEHIAGVAEKRDR